MDIADYPALAPPAGQVSNFINPKSLSPAIIGVNAAFISLMVIVVIIRIYARAFLVKSMGWDDFTCIIAALGSITHTVMVLYDIHLGYGRHLWDIRAITLTVPVIRDISSLAILYPLIIFFVKLSISLLYLRLFSVDTKFKHLVYFGITFAFVFYAGLFGYQIAEFTFCSSTSSGSLSVCTANEKINIAAGVFNVVSDLYLLILPVPLVLRLKLHPKQRAGLAVVLCDWICCMHDQFSPTDLHRRSSGKQLSRYSVYFSLDNHNDWLRVEYWNHCSLYDKHACCT